MLLDGSEGRDLVKVLDFGLAKSLSSDSTNMSVTASGALLGTPAYMSPEAATGGDVDERSDLYSLGCTLYALISGRPPFQSDKVHEMLAMHRNLSPPPLNGVPEPVAAVIMKLLAKQPTSRFRTAAATRHALEEASLPYISRDLETATANTLPGRKKSMPPVLVPPTAATVDATMPKAIEPVKAVVKPRDAADSEAMAATVTHAVALPATLAPDTRALPAAETPASVAAPVVTTIVPAKRRGLGVAVAAVLLVGGVIAVAVAKRGGGEIQDEPQQAPVMTPSSPAVVIDIDASVAEPTTAATLDAAVDMPAVKPAKPPKTVGTKAIPKLDAGVTLTIEPAAVTKPDAGSGKTPW
jgi:hypothetical protein